MATASLVLGILGIVLSFVAIGIVPSILGIIFGAISLHKGKNGMALAGLICSVIGVAIFILMLIITPSSSDSSSESHDNISSSEKTDDIDTKNGDIADHIDVKIVETQESEILCAFVTNNSDKTIGEADIKVLFKDDEGNTIDFDEDGHDVVLPGTTVVSRIHAPSEYASYEVEKNIDQGANSSYENHVDDIKIESNDGNDNLIVEITNNSDQNIEEVEYCVVFYSGDDVVAVNYPTDVYDIGAGTTATEKEYPPDAKYDRYEIFINQAHTFGL